MSMVPHGMHSVSLQLVISPTCSIHYWWSLAWGHWWWTDSGTIDTWQIPIKGISSLKDKQTIKWNKTWSLGKKLPLNKEKRTLSLDLVRIDPWMAFTFAPLYLYSSPFLCLECSPHETVSFQILSVPFASLESMSSETAVLVAFISIWLSPPCPGKCFKTEAGFYLSLYSQVLSHHLTHSRFSINFQPMNEYKWCTLLISLVGERDVFDAV